jgi:benzoyl-CoA reductase/2-hydroxyglutaryl-CoA dehydratase subunit BcrC/BadD/HgdB
VLVKSYCDQRQIPFLAFETDFSNKSVGRLRTQIEAFMESLGQR